MISSAFHLLGKYFSQKLPFLCFLKQFIFFQKTNFRRKKIFKEFLPCLFAFYSKFPSFFRIFFKKRVFSEKYQLFIFQKDPFSYIFNKFNILFYCGPSMLHFIHKKFSSLKWCKWQLNVKERPQREDDFLPKLKYSGK